MKKNKNSIINSVSSFIDKYNYFKKIHWSFRNSERIYRETSKLTTKLTTTLIDNANILFQLNKTKRIKNEKIKIHFLFAVASYWTSWSSFYEACINDENIETKIIHLDLANTEHNTQQYSTSKTFLEEQGMPYTSYNDYDVTVDKPHVLVYQSPYRWYFSKYFMLLKPEDVKKIGVRPIYISYGIEYDISLKTKKLDYMHYQSHTHQHAWRVFVMHDDIRQGFAQHCPAGAHHVKVFGHPKFDSYIKEKADLPQELLEKAQGKKILMYQIHHPFDYDCAGTGRMHTIPLKEIKRIISFLQQQNDVFPVITLHPGFIDLSKVKNLLTDSEAEILSDSIRNHKNSYLYTGNHQALIANSDIFITDSSSLMVEMAFFDKPILYLYDVPLTLKPFVQKIAETFHHGSCLADVKKFMQIALAQDPLLPARKKMQKEIFCNYDGNIGRKIKDHIMQSIIAESDS